MKLILLACVGILFITPACIMIPVAALGIAKLAHMAYKAEHCEKAEDRCGD